MAGSMAASCALAAIPEPIRDGRALARPASGLCSPGVASGTASIVPTVPNACLCEWWKRDAESKTVRDYFQVEDCSGERFWIIAQATARM